VKYGSASIPNIIKWLAEDGPKLKKDPGKEYESLSTNYILLCAAVEKVLGQTLESYLLSTVLQKQSWVVRGWPTKLDAHLHDHMWHESRYVGPDVLDPKNSKAIVPNVYGGDGIYKESAYTSTAMAASAQTVAEFIGTHREFSFSQRVAKFVYFRLP
jgi:hypothetical protein